LGFGTNLGDASACALHKFRLTAPSDSDSLDGFHRNCKIRAQAPSRLATRSPDRLERRRVESGFHP